MELWGNAPVPFTVALLSPGGERVERIQLKVDEFRRIHFFPEDSLIYRRNRWRRTGDPDEFPRPVRRNLEDGSLCGGGGKPLLRHLDADQ